MSINGILALFLLFVLIELLAQTNTPKFIKRKSKRVPKPGNAQKSLGIGMFFLNTCQILCLIILLSKLMYTDVQPYASAISSSVVDGVNWINQKIQDREQRRPPPTLPTAKAYPAQAYTKDLPVAP